MSKLLIENLAPALELDTANLSSSQHKKLCIIIDCALEAYSVKKDPNYSEFSKLLSNKNELDEKELQDLLNNLVKAYKKGLFNQLEMEADPNMGEVIENLCRGLEISDQEMIDRMILNVASMKDYEKEIIKNPQAYTEKLAFKRDLTPFASALQKASEGMIKSFDSLPNKPSIDLNDVGIIFNEAKNRIEVKSEKSLILLEKTQKKGFILTEKGQTPQKVMDMVKFLLQTLLTMDELKKTFNCDKISEDNVKLVLAQLKPLMNSESMKNISAAQASEIRNLLKDLHNILPKNESARRDAAEMLSKFTMEHKILRDWKSINDFTKEDKIHRVILLGRDDIADPEVMSTLALMLKKHPFENIAITFDPNEVTKINKQNADLGNAPFTLQVLGHGALKENSTINANLGPYRGNAIQTGKKVAELVNQCPLIDHVRLTGCFTGRVAEHADLQKGLIEKVPKTRTESRTLTLTTHLPLEANQPFSPESAGVSCWNNIKKDNREISLTVSPGIIEADHEIGHMTWKSSTNHKRVDDEVKEIRVTTEQGKKAPRKEPITEQYKASLHSSSKTQQTEPEEKKEPHPTPQKK